MLKKKEEEKNNFELQQELVVEGVSWGGVGGWRWVGRGERRGGEIFINLLNTFHVQIL